MGLLDQDLNSVRDALRVRRIYSASQVPYVDKFEICEVKSEEYKEVFHNEEIHENKDMFGKSLKKGQENLRNQIKDLIKNPSLDHPESDSLVYERRLGNPEILGSNRWVEKSAKDCSICNKMTYTLFVWNKQLAENQIR